MSADVIALKLMGQLQFCAEMQSTLSRWHPEHEWIVTPQFVKEFGDGVSLSTYGSAAANFLILAGNAHSARREVKPLVCLSCEGEDYHNAADQEKWLRRAAGQILSELIARQTGEMVRTAGLESAS